MRNETNRPGRVLIRAWAPAGPGGAARESGVAGEEKGLVTQVTAPFLSGQPPSRWLRDKQSISPTQSATEAAEQLLLIVSFGVWRSVSHDAKRNEPTRASLNLCMGPCGAGAEAARESGVAGEEKGLVTQVTAPFLSGQPPSSETFRHATNSWAVESASHPSARERGRLRC